MMDIGSILILLVIAAGMAWFMAYPHFKKGSPSMALTPSAISLAEERQYIMRTLQALDFDHATGKILDEDYSRQREKLVNRAADILRQLDEKRPAVPSEGDALEAMIAQRKAQLGAATKPCPNCGKLVRETDTFCAGCGSKLS